MKRVDSCLEDECRSEPGYQPNPVFFCSKTVNSNPRREIGGEKKKEKNESGSVENEGEQEIRRRSGRASREVACQPQRRPGGEKEREKRKEYKRRGLENRQKLDVVSDTDFKDEGRVNAGRMKQMNVGRGRGRWELWDDRKGKRQSTTSLYAQNGEMKWMYTFLVLRESRQ